MRDLVLCIHRRAIRWRFRHLLSAPVALVGEHLMRPKKCPECAEKYQPTRQMQPCCDNMECKASYAIRHIEATRKRRRMQEMNVQKADRKVIKLKLDAIKPRGKLIAEADRAFCAYIRFRDQLAGYLCISSGKPLDWSGNNVDGGRPKAAQVFKLRPHCHKGQIRRQTQSIESGEQINGRFAQRQQHVAESTETHPASRHGRRLEHDQDSKRHPMARHGSLAPATPQRVKCRFRIATGSESPPRLT